MKLLSIFNDLRKGKQINLADIDEDNIHEQLMELLDTLYADNSIPLLKILDYKNPRVIKELAKSSDNCTSACAVLTLINGFLPELELYKYV